MTATQDATAERSTLASGTVPKAVAWPCGDTMVRLLPTVRPKRCASPTPTAIASSPLKFARLPARILLPPMSTAINAS